MNNLMKQTRILILTKQPGIDHASIPVRHMSALKALSMRLKSVKNIQKITKSMKMVSASKYAQADARLKKARPYGIGATQFFEKAKIEPPAEAPQKLIVAITSDKGLCGACHSGIARYIRKKLDTIGSTQDVKIFCLGDKSRTLLRYYHPDKIVMVATEVGRKPPTFLDASLVSAQIRQLDYKFTHGTIIYNKFKTVVSYAVAEQAVFSMPTVMSSDKIYAYDDLEDDMMESYMEYSLASLLFYTMMEGACSEQSSRMTAMDNASKNAGEMIDKLALTFNRTRQAVITRELIEIISGASALN